MSHNGSITVPTMHTAFLLFVLAQHKEPLSQIDLTRQVFPLWAGLTKDAKHWLTLSDEQKKSRTNGVTSLVGNLIKLHPDTIQQTVSLEPRLQRMLALNPKYRSSIVKFTAQFWKAMQILLSKDEILQVQREVQRVYPSSAPQIRL